MAIQDNYSEYAALLNQCDKELDDLYHSYATQCNVSDAALWILYALYDSEDGVTQTDICNCWFFTRQTINTALKSLQQQDNIELASITGNRKSKHIIFTANGRDFAERIIVPLKQAENQVFTAFSKEETKQYIALSQKRCSLLREYLKMT